MILSKAAPLECSAEGAGPENRSPTEIFVRYSRFPSLPCDGRCRLFKVLGTASNLTHLTALHCVFEDNRAARNERDFFENNK